MNVFETFDKPLHSLTKRELFAAMAMQGLLAKSDLKPDVHYAQLAVVLADDLLAALDKPR